MLCAELDVSANIRRGPVMRVDRVLNLGAVATGGACMMPGAFKVFEDATLRARDIFGLIFERGVPSMFGMQSAHSAMLRTHVVPRPRGLYVL